MIKKKFAPKEKSTLKHEINDKITQLLSTSLDSLKEILGEKKFNKRINKAARFLSDGVKTAADKKEVTKKPASKKEPAKPVVKKTVKAGTPNKVVKEVPKKDANVILKKAAKVISKK